MNLMMKERYLSDYPNLMLDWDQALNPEFRPESLSHGSKRMINWQCHKCGRIWRAPVCNRVNGTGCICDAKERAIQKLRKRLVERDGSLAETRPEIAAQWHPTLNGNLTPNDITEQSTYKAWWLGEDGVSWQSVVSVRCRTPNSTKRPKSMIVKGVNDLKTLRPDLASEWNYDRNLDISIESVMPGSKLKVWWICEKGHEWQATVISRHYGSGCPLCNKERSTSFPEQAIYYYIKQVFPDALNRYYPTANLEIDIFIPSHHIGIEYDGSHYHSFEKKKALDARKNIRLKEMGITLIRIVEDGCQAPENTEYLIRCLRKNSIALIDPALHSLVSLLQDILKISISIDIDSERDRASIYNQYILSEKQNSLAAVAPTVIEEWHPTKNGKIVPDYIHAMSNKTFWWKCKKCGYEWKAPAYRRAKGNGCPVCSGHTVAKGYNDLPTMRPDLMEEWAFEKNKGIDPHACSAGSNKRVWWRCKTCQYEWQAVIVNRARGNSCPRCANKVFPIEQSFAGQHPELITEWDYERNGDLRPEGFLSGSEQKIWWKCKKGHSWQTTIMQRSRHYNCPYCGNRKLLTGYNDLAAVHPELLKEWDDQNNTVSPDQVMAGSYRKVSWVCHKGHHWQARIANRAKGTGCPYCDGKLVAKGENDLASQHPSLATEWNYDKNGTLKPDEVTEGSNKRVWWKCSKCGGEWEAIIWSRAKGRGCPYCAGKKAIAGVNDLKTKRPDLASEWNYEKNPGLVPEQFMPRSNAKVWWRCSCCHHEWQAVIGSRSQGRGCPACTGILAH